MPQGDWESVTVPSELLDRLDKHREDDGGKPPYWEVIEDLLDAYESEGGDYNPADYDGSGGVEVLRMDQGVIDDIASATSSSVMRELEDGLR